MQSKEEQNIIIVRLFPGDDLFKSLGEVCRKHKVMTAIILSTVGQLKEFTLGYFNGKEYRYQDFSETHELLGISGIISWSVEDKEYKFHMHVMAGREDKQVIGGHLFKGIIEGTGEIVLQKTSIEVIRRKDPGTGLIGMYLE